MSTYFTESFQDDVKYKCELFPELAQKISKKFSERLSEGESYVMSTYFTESSQDDVKYVCELKSHQSHVTSHRFIVRDVRIVSGLASLRVNAFAGLRVIAQISADF